MEAKATYENIAHQRHFLSDVKAKCKCQAENHKNLTSFGNKQNTDETEASH